MKNWLLLFLISCVSAFGYYPNFDNNPHLNDKMRQLIAPHLIPLDHQAKPILDQIFETHRVCQSKNHILAAGFTILAEMPKSFTFVVRHPALPGYVLKMHLDNEKKGRMGTPSWEWLTLRCKRAKEIQELIQNFGMVHFTVPDKWLYPVPAYVQEKNKQPLILIATDMDLVSHEQSERAWKTIPNRRLLDELYIILTSGYGSSGLPWNIPYTKSGKFAFVDTEREMDQFRKVDRYFSKEMRAYWRSIPF